MAWSDVIQVVCGAGHVMLTHALWVQSATGVTCTMACMSRAGREPGFKKQNQDNCFAFEKYITNEQSLFGAFDGHGPNGMHTTPRWSPCSGSMLSVPNSGTWHEA